MKVHKIGLGLLASATLVLAGCTGDQNKVTFWAPFGSGYTTALNNLVNNFNKSQDRFTVEVSSKGSYKNIQKEITNSITTSSYPHFALGYPDHFAGYIDSSIMIELDDYIEAYDEAHAEELKAKGYESIIDDYYPQYMKENRELKFKPDGTGYTMGIPFNKSTEVLSYNGYMFDYVAANDPSVTEMPNTYAEWETFGQKVRDVIINNAETSLAGKRLFGTADDDGRASGFVVSTEKSVAGKDLLLDCTYVNATNFKVLTWNDLDNMFITLVRQFGGTYTEYTQNDMKVYKHGWATFWDQNNKEKTKLALETIDNLHDKLIFGTASELTGGDSDTASDPFIQNNVFALVSSSGGLSYNLNKNTTRVRLHAVPYNTGDLKFVISQGTNLGLFDAKKFTDEQLSNSFEAMVAISTGEIQGTWAKETGYFPASKSAMESEVYKDFLSHDYGNRQALLRAYKESFVLNRDEYRGEGSTWTQFVDPGFVGSSTIREQVGTILPSVLNRDAGVSIDSCVDAVVAKLTNYIKK